MIRPELFFWFNSPPVVELGATNHVSRHWGAPVNYVCTAPLRSERVALGWGAVEHGDARVITPPEGVTIAQFVNAIVDEFPNALHVVSGFASPAGQYLLELTHRVAPHQIAVVSERPGAYGSLARRLIRRLGMRFKHKRLRRRFGSRIQLLLPLGELGIETFRKFGWPNDQMAKFMYCPEYTGEKAPGTHPQTEPLRLVYVGRFSRFTKGTDVLIRAVEMLPQRPWSLDMIGGYGDLAAFVEAWVEKRSQVHLLGRLEPSAIASILPSYDVCVVPSRFDGWNVVVNEALSAGIGLIVTDQAVSHELVSNSGAGLVVPAECPSAIADAIEHAMMNPAVVEDWRRRAAQYSHRCAQEAVGDYLISLLDTRLLGAEGAAEVPW